MKDSYNLIQLSIIFMLVLINLVIDEKCIYVCKKRHPNFGCLNEYDQQCI